MYWETRMRSCLPDSHLRRALATALCLLAAISAARAEGPSWSDLIFAAGPAAVRADDAPDAPAAETWRLGISVDGAYRYGPIRGYLQTAAGGTPGTTSLRRPTFKELDIDEAGSGQFRLSAEIGRHRIYLGADPLSVSGTSVLGSALVTQGLVFPAGTRVRASARLDLYRIGYQYRVCMDDERPCTFEVAPTIEAAAFDFSYRLTPTAGGARARRNYREETPRLGIEATWFATKDLTVSGRVIGSVPIEDTVNIWTAEVQGRYVLLRGGPVEVTAGAGVGFEHVDYEDSQAMPNHIRVEYGPVLVLSLRVAF